MDEIRYPIGAFAAVLNPSIEERKNLINQIPEITKTLRGILKTISPGLLQTPYRPGGWTVQQVIHHLADNDMNAYLRFKRALTEAEPVGASYWEDLWAELSDYRDVPAETSVLLLEALHSRFLILLQGLQAEDFQRTLRTQVLGSITLDIALQRFIWHNHHHISQITALLGQQ